MVVKSLVSLGQKMLSVEKSKFCLMGEGFMGKVIMYLVSGKAEAGKDTFYQRAQQLYPNIPCVRFALGDEVKEIATLLTWDGKKDERGRTLLQWLGDGARQYNYDVWIERAKTRLEGIIENLKDSNDVSMVFMTDCRYPNEVKKIGGFAESLGCAVVTIRVVRPGHVSRLSEEQLKNTSETALDNYLFDYQVTNKGDSTYTSLVGTVINEILEGVLK